MLKKIFSKQPPEADRRRRLMGGLIDVFDYFEGKTWATVIGAIIMAILVIVSLFPILPE